MPDPTHDVGVLFVHGIGEQQRAGTLVQFGEALADCLVRWLSADGVARSRDCVCVLEASLQNGSGDTPAHASLVLDKEGQDEKWLLAESWWAESFTSPTYADLLKWAFRILPWTIATHFYRRFAIAEGWWKLFAALLLLLGVALLPFVAVLLVLTLSVGILPIPRLRTAILKLQKILLGTVGDSYVLNESSIRGAAMSSQVIRDLGWLRERCDKVVVLAHSQGAAITHAALKSLAESGAEKALPNILVTFGAGLRKLLLLRGVRGKEIFASWLLSVALIGISWAVWQIIDTVWRGDLTQPLVIMNRWGLESFLEHSPIDIRDLFGLDFTDWRVLLSAIAISGFLHGLLMGAKILNRLLIGAGLALLYPLGMLLIYPFLAPGPFIYYTLWWTLIIIAGCFYLGGFTRDNAPEELALADDMTWRDYYAAADPVPNGPITREPLPFIASAKINNRNSLFSDHTTYWQNTEQFVLPVARVISGVCGKSVDVGDDDALVCERASRRRVWRVRWLTLARLFATAFVIAGAYQVRDDVWKKLEQVPAMLAGIVTEILDFLQSIPVVRLVAPSSDTTWLPPALWYALAVLALLVARRLVWVFWSWWDASDRTRLFRRSDYAVLPIPFLVLLAAIGAFVALPLLGEELAHVVRSSVLTSPAMAVWREEGFRAFLAVDPLGLVDAGPLAFFSTVAGAAVLWFLVNWWNWALPFTGSDEDLIDVARDSLWGVAYVPLALPGTALLLWLALGVGTPEPTDISPFLYGLWLMAGIAASVAVGLALWGLGQLEWARGAWLRLRFWSVSGPLGGWLAGRWRREQIGADALAARLRAMLDRHATGEGTREGLWRANVEAETVCRELGARAGAFEPLLLALAERFPYAGVRYAAMRRKSDPETARRVASLHVETRFPRARAAARRLARQPAT